MHSIILTVHNKGWLIDKVIQGIKDNTVGEYELIVVVDGCTDNSEEVVKKNVEGLKNYTVLLLLMSLRLRQIIWDCLKQ